MTTSPTCNETHLCAHCKALAHRERPQPRLWVDVNRLAMPELATQGPRFVERGGT